MYVSKGTSKPFIAQLDRLFWRLDLSLEDSRDASLDPPAMSSVQTCNTLNMYTDSTSHNSHQLSCWINTCSSSLATLTGVAVRKDKWQHHLMDYLLIMLPFVCFSRLEWIWDKIFSKVVLAVSHIKRLWLQQTLSTTHCWTRHVKNSYTEYMSNNMKETYLSYWRFRSCCLVRFCSLYLRTLPSGTHSSHLQSEAHSIMFHYNYIHSVS